MTAAAVAGCPLCEGDGGPVVARAAHWRLVRAGEDDHPAFWRLVWNAHVAEFSDLPDAQRAECMDVLVRAERLVRTHLAPTKVNLATLGNVVPHLHWHLVARFDWDTHFPAPVWAGARRLPEPARLADLQARLPALESDLACLGRPS